MAVHRSIQTDHSGKPGAKGRIETILALTRLTKAAYTPNEPIDLGSG